MNEITNTVYIVGGDHHNGLGLARILGIHHIKVISLVITTNKSSFLSKSKFVDECLLFESEKKAYDYLSKLQLMEKKAFIIPYSDTAAFELDQRLDEFKYKYYVPSINCKQGEIAKLMDKQVQYDFAVKSNIKVALTETINIQSEDYSSIDKMRYPCIVKPVISAEGHKRDISVCQTKDALIDKISELKKLKYKRVLVQEYLKVDYEIDVFGAILHQEPFICQIPTHTIRSWLPEGGTNSFSYIITNEKIIKACKELITKVMDIGFYGLYDIELFVVDGKIYLNEINLRNSGDVYMGLNQSYYYPYAWICDCLGLKADILPYPTRKEYTMTECADIRNVLVHNVSLIEWIKDFKKSSDFALKFKGDMKPAYNRYLYYLKQFITGKRL